MHNEKDRTNTNNQDTEDISVNIEEEYSEELADVEDREAQARAKAADTRVHKDNI
ncbi:YfhD family protein [Evansella sp. AB-rgal1]|uniref:YfhD family protein n=1 Tax=Evansella sp. AB-rgal1 TaxID=3242696 RepID=UPI00359DDE4F